MLPNQVKLTLENITLEPRARLIGVQPLYEYVDGVRGDKQIGFSYEVLAEKNGFEKFIAKVNDLTPVMSAEQISEATEPIYIGFTDFQGSFYFNRRKNTFDLTCKASKAFIIKSPTKTV